MQRCTCTSIKYVRFIAICCTYVDITVYCTLYKYILVHTSIIERVENNTSLTRRIQVRMYVSDIRYETETGFFFLQDTVQIHTLKSFTQIKMQLPIQK